MAVAGEDQVWDWLGDGPYASEAELDQALAAKETGAAARFYAIRVNTQAGSVGPAVGYASLMRMDPVNGVIEVGKVADITVFNLDEIEMRPEKKIWDVPDGKARTYRYTRDPAPMRLTLVNGVPTFDQGEFTGRYPGGFIGPEVPSVQEDVLRQLPASHLETV